MNDPVLLQRLLPALRAAGARTVRTDARLRAAADNFSGFLQDGAPGLYYILGSTPGFTSLDAAPSNHSDRFDIDESVLPLGVAAHVQTALAVLRNADPPAR